MQNGTRKAYFNFSLAAFDTTTTGEVHIDLTIEPFVLTEVDKIP